MSNVKISVRLGEVSEIVVVQTVLLRYKDKCKEVNELVT